VFVLIQQKECLKILAYYEISTDFGISVERVLILAEQMGVILYKICRSVSLLFEAYKHYILLPIVYNFWQL
jgi:hypothetical protein